MKTKQSKKEAAFLLAMKNAERFNPAPEEGLTEEQVAERTAAGLYNADTAIKSKTYGAIFRDNLFTYFNLIWAVIATALIIVGSWNDLFFLVIISANVAIGIIQEIRAKKKLDELTLVGTAAVTVVRGGEKIEIKKEEVVLDDIMFLRNGQQVTSDSILVEGSCEVNEAMLTGESVPVPKQVGSQLLAGSFISSGSCYVRVDKIGADNYIQTLMQTAKSFKATKSKMLLALQKLIKIIGIIIIPITLILGYINYNVWPGDWKQIVSSASGSTIGMIPAGMYLLTSVALFTSFLSLAKKDVWVQELYSIEMLARVDVLCLDKTGTITDGTMKVTEVTTLIEPLNGHTTDEIMSSILHAVQDKGMTNEALTARFGDAEVLTATEAFPFSSEKKYSGATFGDEGTYIVGAPEFVMKELPDRVRCEVEARAKEGLRVLLLAHIGEGRAADGKAKAKAKTEEKTTEQTTTAVAIIAIEDHIRDDAPATLKWFADNNVTCKVISGDNPVTVAAVAKKAGILNAEKLLSLDGLTDEEVRAAANEYTVFGRVSPEQKRILVKAIKAEGHTVAMTGDGVNDILALKESDCAVAMAAGSEAARNVAHLVLMDNNFAKMPEVVANGRRVVNNIERTTSVFLMKTIFTVLLSVIIAATGLIRIIAGKIPAAYPFSPNNLTIIEFAVIGIPSVLLAFQPNSNLIKGNFLSNVFKKSIAPGITLLICYYAVVAIGKHFNIDGIEMIGQKDANAFGTMSVAVFSLVGWFMLMRVCRPFNGYRMLVCAGSMAIILICIFALGPFVFNLIPALPLEYYLFALAVIFASVYIADALNLGTDALFHLAEKKMKIKK